MSHQSIGRRSIAVAAISVIFATAACGTKTDTVDDVQPGSSSVVQTIPHMSADAAERQGRSVEPPHMSADAAERQGAKEDAVSKRHGHPTTPDARIPD